MRLKRSLFFTLILFFMIFSVSFVNASEISTNDADTDNTILSAISEDSVGVDDSNDMEIRFTEDSSTLNQSDEGQTNETKSEKREAPILGANNDEQLDEM